MGIRRKIILALWGAALLPLVFLFVISTWQQLQRTLKDGLTGAQSSLERSIATQDAFLGVVAGQDVFGIAMEQAFFSDAESAMQSALKHNDAIKSLSLVGPNWAVQSSTIGDKTPTHLRVEETASKTESLHHNKIDPKTHLLRMAAKVNALTGQPLGWLVAEVDSKALFQKMDASTLSIRTLAGENIWGSKDINVFFSQTKTMPSLGITLESQQTLGGLIDQTSSEIVIMLGIALLAVLCVALAARPLAARLADPIEDASRQVSRLANGELNLSLKVAAHDETGKLAESFNGAVARLRDMIGNIQNVAVDLAGRSHHLENITRQTSEGTVEIATQVERVAHSATHVSELITNTREQGQATHQALGLIQEELTTTQNAALLAEKASTRGLDVIVRLNQQMDHLKQENHHMASELEALNQQTLDITKSVAYIASISEQVTLLSLNASIEAVHAGEAGKGFAVVAQEVGKLAGFSRQASKEINTIVRRIQDRTKQSLQAMTINTEAVVQTNTLAGELTTSFEDIKIAIVHINTLFNRVKGGSEDITKAMEDLDRLHQAAAFITSSSGSATESMSASVEELSASSQEVTAFAEELGQLASRLVETVQFFSTKS